MQKWEYHINTIPDRDFVYQRMSILAKAGSEGWELVQILCDIEPSNRWYTFVFKRPIKEKYFRQV